MSTGRQAILAAFDQLFDAAAGRLQITCTPEERAGVRAQFAERMAGALEAADASPTPVAVPEAVLAEMRAAISGSPAEIAALVASIRSRSAPRMLRAVASSGRREAARAPRAGRLARRH
jgi:hypothetical protein